MCICICINRLVLFVLNGPPRPQQSVSAPVQAVDSSELKQVYVDKDQTNPPPPSLPAHSNNPNNLTLNLEDLDEESSSDITLEHVPSEALKGIPRDQTEPRQQTLKDFQIIMVCAGIPSAQLLFLKLLSELTFPEFPDRACQCIEYFTFCC